MQSNDPSQTNREDKATWWLKCMTRAFGCLGGICAIISGIFTVATMFKTVCVVAGILQMVIGFFAAIFEAPCCCQFLSFAVKVGKFSEQRPYYQKAIAYIILSIIPVIMCFGMSTVFGDVLLCTSGLLYISLYFRKRREQKMTPIPNEETT